MPALLMTNVGEQLELDTATRYVPILGGSLWPSTDGMNDLEQC